MQILLYLYNQKIYNVNDLGKKEINETTNTNIPILLFAVFIHFATNSFTEKMSVHEQKSFFDNSH